MKLTSKNKKKSTCKSLGQNAKQRSTNNEGKDSQVEGKRSTTETHGVFNRFCELRRCVFEGLCLKGKMKRLCGLLQNRDARTVVMKK